MRTRKVKTRFMNANVDVDGDIANLLIAEYGMIEVLNCGIDFDEAFYSDGFIYAIEEGKIPTLNSICESFLGKKHGEYHHLIHEDKCYVMYFE